MIIYTYYWLEKFNISYNDLTNKEYITQLYLEKNQLKFASSSNISNYHFSYRVDIQENYTPWIHIMISFSANLNHKNVSYSLVIFKYIKL